MSVGTAQDCVNQAIARLGKGYSETKDGGVGPDWYDCSGLCMVCLNEIGIACPRDSEDQDAFFPHISTPTYGCLVTFEVPQDGGRPPQHIGIWLGPNLMIEAPHTGEVVKYSSIPNIPGVESIYSYLQPPYASSNPVPPPPVPRLQELDEMDSTTAPNGDIISHAMGAPGTASAGHYFEITRKAGTQGQPPTAQNISIIDMTATWSFFTVGG